MKVKTSYQLNKGDFVTILSPAKALAPNENINELKSYLENWGLNVIISSNCTNSLGYYSGSIEERLNDFTEALENPKVKAIFCCCGGFGSIHLIEYLAPLIKKNPKWIIGFSDICNLHAICVNSNILSIHASMGSALYSNEANLKASAYIRDILFGKRISYNIDSHPLNRQGIVTGKLIGGNLATLSNLINTPFDILSNADILFLEDIHEPIYKVERIFYNLRLSGVLKRLKGLIVGQFTDYREPDANGDTMYGMIRCMIEPYDFPVCFGFPIGHIDGNLPIIEGATATLNIAQYGVKLEFLHA